MQVEVTFQTRSCSMALKSNHLDNPNKVLVGIVQSQANIQVVINRNDPLRVEHNDVNEIQHLLIDAIFLMFPCCKSQ